MPSKFIVAKRGFQYNDEGYDSLDAYSEVLGHGTKKKAEDEAYRLNVEWWKTESLGTLLEHASADHGWKYDKFCTAFEAEYGFEPYELDYQDNPKLKRKEIIELLDKHGCLVYLYEALEVESL